MDSNIDVSGIFVSPINYDQIDLSAAQINGIKAIEEDQDAMGMMNNNGQIGNIEYKEKGIKALFTKG
jgi:hypothetical protein